MPTERNRTGCVACPRFIFSSRTNICKAVFLPSPLSTITRHVEKCFDIFSPVRNFPSRFIYLFLFWGILLKKKKINVKNLPTTRVKRAGCRDLKKQQHILRREFELSRYWNVSYFNTQTNNVAIKRFLAATRDVLSARRTRHFKLVLALVSTETASWTLRRVLFLYLKINKFKKKKNERGKINRVRFRRLSEHAAAAEEPRAAAVTCLTCPSFFPPVALSVSRSPLLPSFLSLPALSLSLTLALPLFTSSSAAARATSFSCCSRSNMACAHVQNHVQIFTQPLCGRLRGQQGGKKRK